MDSVGKKTENCWQRYLMLTCFGLLIVAMCIVCLRFLTAKVILNKYHIDNAWTYTIFADNLKIRTDWLNGPRKDVAIDWKKEYPFADEQVQQNHKPTIYERIKNKQTRVEGIVVGKMHKHELEDFSTKAFWNYQWFFEHGRAYEKLIGWNVVNPAMNIMEFDDGYLTSVTRRYHQQEERIQSIADLRDFVETQGAKFFFVQAPCKTNPYNDAKINGHFDFSNANADDVLQGLTQKDVDVLDLRPMLSCGLDDTAWHAQFYRTDHHWKPQTAVRAASFVAQKLQAEGINVDGTHYSPQDYEWVLFPKYFLGSQGKRMTLAKTEPDDFELAEPKFPVNWHVEIPSEKVDTTGDFSIVYDYHQLERRDYYNLNPYAVYIYGDRPIEYFTNLRMPQNAKKVMAITDSYGDTLILFLAIGVREIIKVDMRHFTGSLHTLIEKEKPDVVFVMYTATSYGGKMNWNSHTDEFDFR